MMESGKTEKNSGRMEKQSAEREKNSGKTVKNSRKSAKDSENTDKSSQKTGKNSTQGLKNAVIGIILCAVAGAGIALYFLTRGTVAGKSPYTAVNCLEKQSAITFTCERAVYAPDTDTIRLIIHNDAYEWLVPETSREDEWVLEKKVDGVWHTMRTLARDVCWDFPPQSYQNGVRPAGIVESGSSLTYLCNLWLYYSLPLDPGFYRIVFPRMRLTDTQDLAAEFEVQ